MLEHLKDLIPNLTAEDQAIIAARRLKQGALSTYKEDTVVGNLVDAVTAFHLLKYKTNQYILAVNSEVIFREIAAVDDAAEQPLLHEKYDLMTRAASCALGALLFARYFQANNAQTVADDLEKRIFDFAKQFMEQVNGIAEQLDGTLADRDYKKLKKGFETYMRELAGLLPVNAGLAQKHKALVKAEQYVNWELKRPNYCTRYKIGDLRVAQETFPLDELSKKQTEEFDKIFGQSNKLPFWFTQLPVWEQNYLRDKVKNYSRSIHNPKSAAERTTPGNSNSVRNNLVVNGSTKSGEYFSLVLKSYSHTVPSPIGIRSKALADNDKTLAVRERKRLAEQNLEQVLSAAGLYCVADRISVGDAKDTFLEHWGIDPDAIPAHIKFTLPVIDRGLLTPLNKSALGFIDRFNYADNNSGMLTEKQAAAAEIQKKIEAGIERDKEAQIKPALYLPNYPINGIRGVVAEQMAEATKQQALGFVQNVADILVNVVRAKRVNTIQADAIYQLHNKLTAIRHINQISPKILEQIEALNLTHLLVVPPLDSPNLEETISLLPDDTAGKKAGLLKKALVDYIKLHQTSEHNDNNKQLFLAALESIINGSIGGIDMMHCKSAKDRRALVTMQTLAMMSYFAEYDELPDYAANDAAKRQNFVAIFAKIYCAFHDAEQANFNSRGSAGIKEEAFSLQNTLPKDIQQAIGRLLVVSQRSASMNKPKFRHPIPWQKIAGLAAAYTLLTVLSMLFLTPLIGPMAVIPVGLVLGSLFGMAAGYLTPGPTWLKCTVGALVGLLAFAPFLAPVMPGLLTALGVSGAAATQILAVTSVITAGLQSMLAPIHIGLLTIAATLSAKLSHWYNTRRNQSANGDFAQQTLAELKPTDKHNGQFSRLLDNKPNNDRSESESDKDENDEYQTDNEFTEDTAQALGINSTHHSPLSSSNSQSPSTDHRAKISPSSSPSDSASED